MFGIVHSPLVELSGVCGGREPRFCVIPDGGSGTIGFAFGCIAVAGLRYVGDAPVGIIDGEGRWWNAASSFSSARRVFVKGFAHCVWESAAAAAAAGELSAAGDPDTGFMIGCPRELYKGLRSTDASCGDP